MLLQKQPVIHPIKLAAAEDEIEFVGAFEEIAEILTHRVCRALVPARGFRRLLSRENLDKILRKIIKFIAGIDMAMQRGTVELRQDITPPESRVETVTDRYIDQSIFSGQRDRRFRAVLGQRKQARSRAASHDDRKCFVRKG